MAVPRPPKAAVTLDMKDKACPLPVLRAKLALAQIEPGHIVRVLATDPHTEVDFKAFCAKTGHELVRQETRGRVLQFDILRVAGAPL